jgi:HPt (histidine-containing phosphotransfer) domain-containing protein
MADQSSGLVDFSHLERFLGGDKATVVKVLELFCQDAEAWDGDLGSSHDDWRVTVHTVKGVAQNLAAGRLAQACGDAETAGAEQLPLVQAELRGAVAEMTAYIVATQAEIAAPPTPTWR